MDNGDNLNPTPGSLRAAILTANSNPGATIDFSALGLGLHTIMLPTVLPDITASGATIDGSTLKGDEIEINGLSAGNIEGLVLAGASETVRGLSIVNCEAAGVLVEGTTDQVSNCFLGIDFQGTAGLGDGLGIYVFQANGVLLQGDDIENNGFDGVQVFDSTGVDIDQNSMEGNFADGIRVLEAMPSASGRPFTTRILGNQIDLNGGNGVHLVDSSNNIIGETGNNEFNWIGSDPEGDTNEPNGGNGVLIESSGSALSTENSITGNFIAGNLGNGVDLAGPGTSKNSVVDNFIGLSRQNVAETFKIIKLPNHENGVAVADGANNNAIGGPGLFLGGDANNGSGNIISDNLRDGVRLSGTGTTLNTVQGNLIGTDDSGTTGVGNGGIGVVIAQGAANNLIGGTGSVHNFAGQGNLISGNLAGGVLIGSTGTITNTIEGDFIGTDVTGLGFLGNGGPGVAIKKGAGTNTVIDNLISGNQSSGVVITGALTTGNMIEGNSIGTNLFGLAALANLGDGVFIAGGATGNIVSSSNQISGNRLNGVVITGAGTSNNLVQGNTIGTDPLGQGAIPNGLNGVVLNFNASNNTIGGGGAGTGNLISGNTDSGVVMLHSATANLVLGNRIGTNQSGNSSIGNGLDGVGIFSSGNMIIGNLISGNNDSGVRIEGSQNFVQGNRIGTDSSGTTAVKNQRDGVVIFVATGTGGNLVGGPASGTGNLISGNGANGIHIAGPGSSGNLILGNDIGTNASGTSAIANSQNGILISNTTGYQIGGAGPGAGNLISGNAQDGVRITGRLSFGISLQGNRIGTDVTGSLAVANQANGVDIQNGAHDNAIGGGNVISGNVGDGIQISQGAGHNIVLGNRIGTDQSGMFYLSNQGNGVDIFSAADNNTVGLAAGAGNLISGNLGDGVRIAQEADFNMVVGNRIGTDESGTTPRHNGGAGVDILLAASTNSVGGGNLISGNQSAGVVITGAGTAFNIVQGNFIGTVASGAAALANLGDGVDILNGAVHNQVGGSGGVTAGGSGNLISGNSGDGVRIIGNGTSFNAVEGNLIGIDAAGNAALSNLGHGVYLAFGAHDNTIGGTAAPGNTIAFNGKAGVAVGFNPSDFPTIHNLILSNHIFANLGLGIDLADNGMTPNTPGGPHPGPNEFQNFPMIVDAVGSGLVTHVVIKLESIPVLSTVFTIQLFIAVPDPSGFGQGRELVATAPLTITSIANGSGVGAITLTISPNLAGRFLTATATAPAAFSETSEFSANFQVRGTAAAAAFSAQAPGLAVNGPVNGQPAPLWRSGRDPIPADLPVVSARRHESQSIALAQDTKPQENPDPLSVAAVADFFTDWQHGLFDLDADVR
jgi:parallel beta-helix repeat protein